MAWYRGAFGALEIDDRKSHRREIFDRIAFATRYGHIPYSEAMAIPVIDLHEYLEAVANLVRQENTSTKS